MTRTGLLAAAAGLTVATGVAYFVILGGDSPAPLPVEDAPFKFDAAAPVPHENGTRQRDPAEMVVLPDPSSADSSADSSTQASPPITDAAAAQPEMSTMDGEASEYDAPTEARQRFRALEMDAIGDRPLTPAKWRAILSDHGDDARGVLQRAVALNQADQPDAARELMQEWERLHSLYRNEAYGRGQVLVEE